MAFDVAVNVLRGLVSVLVALSASVWVSAAMAQSDPPRQTVTINVNEDAYNAGWRPEAKSCGNVSDTDTLGFKCNAKVWGYIGHWVYDGVHRNYLLLADINCGGQYTWCGSNCNSAVKNVTMCSRFSNASTIQLQSRSCKWRDVTWHQRYSELCTRWVCTGTLCVNDVDEDIVDAVYCPNNRTGTIQIWGDRHCGELNSEGQPVGKPLAPFATPNKLPLSPGVSWNPDGSTPEQPDVAFEGDYDDDRHADEHDVVQPFCTRDGNENERRCQCAPGTLPVDTTGQYNHGNNAVPDYSPCRVINECEYNQYLYNSTARCGCPVNEKFVPGTGCVNQTDLDNTCGDPRMIYDTATKICKCAAGYRWSGNECLPVLDYVRRPNLTTVLDVSGTELATRLCTGQHYEASTVSVGGASGLSQTEVSLANEYSQVQKDVTDLFGFAQVACIDVVETAIGAMDEYKANIAPSYESCTAAGFTLNFTGNVGDQLTFGFDVVCDILEDNRRLVQGLLLSLYSLMAMVAFFKRA